MSSTRQTLMIVLTLMMFFSCKEKNVVTNSDFKFVEFTEYTLHKSFPPKISLKFKMACNEEFIKVVRHETRDKKSGEVKLAMGGIVKINKENPCVSEATVMFVPAGEAVIGASAEIIKISR